MMKKKIALVLSIVAALVALLVVIGVFLPHVTAETINGKESFSAFDTMKNLKKDNQEVSVALTYGTYGVLIMGLIMLFFAGLRIASLVTDIKAFNLVNGKLARFLFVILGISLLVCGFLFSFAAGNPVGTANNTEEASKIAELANSAWKAMTKTGIGTILVYACGMIAPVAAIASNITCKKLNVKKA